MNSKPHLRQLPRLAASAVALATVTGLVLAGTPIVSAQQAPPSAAQSAEEVQNAPPPERTDTQLRAAPMPADAMPLNEKPARPSILINQSVQPALTQEQWNRRPVDLRGEAPVLEQEWQPTENPQRALTPGEMRSDREEIPAGFTKEQADLAETMEAELNGGDGTIGILAAPGCQVYWPAP